MSSRIRVSNENQSRFFFASWSTTVYDSSRLSVSSSSFSFAFPSSCFSSAPAASIASYLLTTVVYSSIFSVEEGGF